MSKILSADIFRWNISVLIWNFVLIFSQSNQKKVCWPEIALYGTFLAPCCCTLLLNQHVFSRHKKGSVFIRSEKNVSKYQSTFYSWTNPRLISSSILQHNISEIQKIWMRLQIYLHLWVSIFSLFLKLRQICFLFRPSLRLSKSGGKTSWTRCHPSTPFLLDVENKGLRNRFEKIKKLNIRDIQNDWNRNSPI